MSEVTAAKAPVREGLHAHHVDAATIAQVMSWAERARLDTAVPDDQVVGAEPALSALLAQGPAGGPWCGGHHPTDG